MSDYETVKYDSGRRGRDHHDLPSGCDELVQHGASARSARGVPTRSRRRFCARGGPDRRGPVVQRGRGPERQPVDRAHRRTAIAGRVPPGPRMHGRDGAARDRRRRRFGGRHRHVVRTGLRPADHGRQRIPAVAIHDDLAGTGRRSQLVDGAPARLPARVPAERGIGAHLCRPVCGARARESQPCRQNHCWTMP